MPVCAHCGEEHPLPGSYRSHVLTCKEGNGAVAADESIEEPSTEGEADTSTQPTLEQHVERVIEDQLEEIRTDIEQLSDDIEEVEQFATISLGERRLSQAEANVEELSASLTEFSEQTLEKVNSLESRLEQQTIVLATVLEALDESDIDVDTTAIRDYQQEQIVTDQAPDEKLETALDQLES
ncbi:hypothetical protein RBH26_14975 [Natronolimnohabitans sp. A-GB9]|uniref:hypothetical protein n=1 Tax=Natronolimnohabitans sp. A-GB9 TaxID=3069757 RepID=UPI0027B0905A|nr:hypothetical protein [Natronolimnohabitans sp. A-GB9]MDQ2051779.1 hypothetical protein [Natronolimnohabitans sp. A-GB9]